MFLILIMKKYVNKFNYSPLDFDKFLELNSSSEVTDNEHVLLYYRYNNTIIISMNIM